MVYGNDILEKALSVNIDYHGDKLPLRSALVKELYQVVEDSELYSAKHSIFGSHFDELAPVFALVEPGIVKFKAENKDSLAHYQILNHKKANDILQAIINYAFLPIGDKK